MDGIKIVKAPPTSVKRARSAQLDKGDFFRQTYCSEEARRNDDRRACTVEPGWLLSGTHLEFTALKSPVLCRKPQRLGVKTKTPISYH